jgi:hypothetical protein
MSSKLNKEFKNNQSNYNTLKLENEKLKLENEKLKKKNNCLLEEYLDDEKKDKEYLRALAREHFILNQRCIDYENANKELEELINIISTKIRKHPRVPSNTSNSFIKKEFYEFVKLNGDLDALIYTQMNYIKNLTKSKYLEKKDLNEFEKKIYDQYLSLNLMERLSLHEKF